MKSRRKMKSSGIPWLGDVPEGWDIKKGKYCLRQINRPTKEEDGVITCFRDGEVTLRSKRREEGFTVSMKEIGYQGIEPGDLVVHGMDGFAGSIGVSDSRGKASPVLIVLDTEQDKKFLMYYLRTVAYKNVFVGLATGIRVRSCDLRWPKLAELPYLLPPLPEQRAIAERIDCEVARVDALREKIKREIERLGDYKKSLIAETVTRGLRKRKMKPSGIPWLGDVPAEWEVIPLFKLVCQVKLPNDGMVEKNLLSLSYGRIIRKDMETASGLVPENYAGYNRIEANDIVLRLTDLQNDQKSLRVGLSQERGIVTSAYLTIRPNADCIADYLAYVIKVFDFKKGFYGIGSGVRQSLKFSEVKKIFIALPPLPEQREIAAYLDRAVTRIDAVVARRKAQVEKLEAFKRSLIQEYVTGKREVCL
jgi:type I restriction enzyme S subunit